MNFMKRTFISIHKRPLKSLLLLGIIFILGNLMIGAYIIRASTSKLEISFKQRLGAKVSVTAITDLSESPDFPRDTKTLNRILDEYTALLDFTEGLEAVNAVDYIIQNDLYIFDSIAVHEYYLGEADPSDIYAKAIGHHSSHLMGVSNHRFRDIREKTINIASGRSFSAEEVAEGRPVAMIHKDTLLQFNDSGEQVQTGDIIPYTLSIFAFNEEDEQYIAYQETINIEVIGSFTKNMDVITNRWCDGNSGHCRNELIYVPANFLRDMQAKLFAKAEELKNDTIILNTGYLRINDVRVYIDSVDNMDQVVKEMQDFISDKGNIGRYEIITSAKEYERIAGPLVNLNAMGQVLLVASSLITVVILALVIILFLRDRKHELGIYVSLGEHMHKIILQIVMEVMIVAILGVSLSLFSGRFLASALSSQMLKIQQDSITQEEGILDDEISYEDLMEEFQITLAPEYIVSIYLITLSSVLLATLAPVIYILRINPKKILM